MTSVNVYLVDADASAYYRLTEPVRALRAQGADVQLCRSGIETRDADTFVFNRPIRQEQANVVQSLVDAGRRVVVDIDDDFDNLPSTHQMHGRYTTEHLHRACQAASAVVVSTPALAEVYGYDNAIVVPNYVPAWYLDVVATHNPIPTLLWYGTVSSHPDDLQVTERGVTKALTETAAQMRYIGPTAEADYVRWALKLKQPVQCAGWFSDKRALFQAIADADVGIVPLANNTFNASKSWLKGLEFAATGVPFVASPRPEYARLHGLGAGLLGRYPNDWYRSLTELLANADYRAHQAGRNREAAARLTIEGNCQQFWDAWTGE